jgi:hypothetical protein
LLLVHKLLQRSLLFGASLQHEQHSAERLRVGYGTLVELPAREREDISAQSDPIARTQNLCVVRRAAQALRDGGPRKQEAEEEQDRVAFANGSSIDTHGRPPTETARHPDQDSERFWNFGDATMKRG